MATYYMSTTGNDGTGDGSIGSPWKTIEHSSAQLNPGDTLYIRGGTHRSAKADTIVNRFYINGMDGTSGNIITITNYPGETVVFNLDDVYVPGTAGDGPVGFKIENSSWFHLNGIRITGLEQNPANINSPCGFIVYDCDDWTIERFIIDNIEGYGFYVQGTKNPGGIGCHRGLVLNCDVHDVGDVYSGWGGANGFQCTGADLSDDITFRGCRAWRCSDDGFDLYSVDGVFKFEDCWAFWNGYQPNVAPLTTAGDGMGFKLGPNDTDQSGSIKKYLHRCLSFENRRFGFDQNVSGAPTCQFQVYNCIAYDNKDNQSFFFGGNTGINQTFKNNIALLPTTVNGSEITSGPNVSNNTWNGGVTVTTADFVSVDSTGVDGARQSDGSLPVLDFLKLTSGSDLIDAGVNVGFAYNGSAPDMGPYEFGTGNASPVADAGTDQNITLPTTTTTLDGSNSTDSDGTIVSYAWTQISGTSATIVSPSSAITNITGLSTAGTRTFRLTVTDDDSATDTDDINVTVNTAAASASVAKFLKMAGVIASSYQSSVIPDVDVDYTNGTNITQTGTVWDSTDGVSHFCGRTAGYLPFGQAGYYYSDITNIATDDDKGTVLALKQGSDFTDCTELDNWGTAMRYAVEPVTGSTFYRVWDGVAEDHTTTAVTYQNGDKYGLFMSSGGVVTAQYYRGGSWTVMHTFATNASGNLYLGVNGFEWSHVTNPKASGNLV